MAASGAIMFNSRRIRDHNLQRALVGVQKILARHDLAGAVMLVAPTEAAFTYKMYAGWSAISYDNSAELGFRFTANSQREGKEVAHQRVEAAMHTICQLADFGDQTTAWMEDMKLMLRRAGINFDHTPFGGRPLQHLVDRGPGRV